MPPYLVQVTVGDSPELLIKDERLRELDGMTKRWWERVGRNQRKGVPEPSPIWYLGAQPRESDSLP